MKKSKFFLAAGAIILAATAVFATKANKRFSPGLRTAANSGAFGGHIIAPSAIFTTKGNFAAFHEVFISINTAGGKKTLQALSPLKNGSAPIFVTDVNSF